jgi:hypothetical protein
MARRRRNVAYVAADAKLDASCKELFRQLAVDVAEAEARRAKGILTEGERII